jgi:CspA family cold shock protein
MSTRTTRGVVRYWREDDGWGVLDSPATPGGCWAHFSAVQMDGYRTLAAGQPVTFSFEPAEQDGFVWQAVEVTVPGTTSAPAVADVDRDAYRSQLHLDGG